MKRIKKIFCIIASVLMFLSSNIILYASPSLVSVNSGSDTSIPTSVIVGNWNGTGDNVIQSISLPGGYSYKVSATHSGKRNFIVKFYNGDKTDYLFNKIGNYSGTVLLEDGLSSERNDCIIEIKADGAWTITISTVTNSSTRLISGTGDKVTGLFTLDNKNNVFTISNTGNRNFVVWIHYTDGSRDLLTNTIGNYSGQVVVKGKSKCQCYLDVVSSGTWSIDMGYGDIENIVPDIN